MSRRYFKDIREQKKNVLRTFSCNTKFNRQNMELIVWSVRNISLNQVDINLLCNSLTLRAACTGYQTFELRTWDIRWMVSSLTVTSTMTRGHSWSWKPAKTQARAPLFRELNYVYVFAIDLLGVTISFIFHVKNYLSPSSMQLLDQKSYQSSPLLGVKCSSCNTHIGFQGSKLSKHIRETLWQTK